MRRPLLHILLPVIVLALSLMSCDRTPRGVMSVNAMADLIADLQLAEAYMDAHISDFQTDSSKQVLKQSVFMKHGITQQDYDSSLVWYAHNMEDYVKAHDKALGKLKSRYDKLDKAHGQPENSIESEIVTGEPTHNPVPNPNLSHPRSGMPHHKLSTDTKGDSADLWQGRRSYILTQGSKRGFIPFDILPDPNRRPGDRYQLGYKLTRGGNEFKVCLTVDYADGGTAQITRGTNSDGWVYIDLQSDTTRQVRRIYGYVSYDIKRGHVACVDSLMLMRTHLSQSNYGYIHAQRLLERKHRTANK